MTGANIFINAGSMVPISFSHRNKKKESENVSTHRSPVTGAAGGLGTAIRGKNPFAAGGVRCVVRISSLAIPPRTCLG